MSAVVRLDACLVTHAMKKCCTAMISLFLAFASKQSGYLSFSMSAQLVHQSEGWFGLSLSIAAVTQILIMKFEIN